MMDMIASQAEFTLCGWPLGTQVALSKAGWAAPARLCSRLMTQAGERPYIAVSAGDCSFMGSG
jgi:hypothetical protein